MMSLVFPFVQWLTIFHCHGMTIKNSMNDWRNYTCRTRFTLMDVDFRWKLFCSADLSQHKNCASVWSRAYDMILCPSVCLSHHATTAVTCSRFAAERRAYTTSSDAVLATARHSAANARNVAFTADVGIRKLKSDLGKSSESVQCAMLKACDACADMGQLQRTVPIRKTFPDLFLQAIITAFLKGRGWL